jgi:hypothetical protein
MRVDEDPDVGGDQDVARDRDKSLNYKDIGGSLSAQVVRRVLAEEDRVPAKSKETGKTVLVSPRTLREEPHKYEEIKREEKKGELDRAQLQQFGDQLRELVKDNPALKSKLQSLITPGQELHGFAQNNPEFSVSQVFRGIELPEGLTTLGDLQKAFATKPSKSKAKPKGRKTPKPKEVEKAPEEGKEPPAKGEPEEDASEEPEHPKVQEWVASGRHKEPQFQRFLEAIPTSELENGQVMVLDSKKRVPFEELPPEKQSVLIESFEQEEGEKKKIEKDKRARKKLIKDGAEASKLLLDVKNGPAWDLVQQLSDPTSEPSERLNKLAEEHDLEFVRPEKAFPELKGALPDGLSDNLRALKKALDAKRSYDSLSEFERAGIPEPERPEPSEAERREVLAEIVDTFPPELVVDIISKNLHPTDARELVRNYSVARRQKPKNVRDLVAKTQQFFATDPADVKPPRTVMQGGKKRVFASLPLDEQAEAMRKHQMQVLAASLAAKDRLSYELSLPSMTNRPRVPPELASTLADFMLRGGSEKQAKKQAEKAFEEHLDSGQHIPIREGVAKKLLSQLDPATRRIARGFLEANDYQEAKAKFLNRTPFESEESFSELDDANNIAQGMRKASDFFRKKSKLYGTSRHPGGVAFKVRILSRLRALAPQKVPVVRAAMDRLDADEYDQQLALYREWEKRKAKAEKAMWKWDTSYQAPGKKRPEPFSEPEPPKPVKPVRYDVVRGKKEEVPDLFEDLANRSKVAAVLERYRNSTYLSRLSMDQHRRTAVYHGVDPEEERPTSYPQWNQAQQGKLGEADYRFILDSAQEWLKNPVLADDVKGVLRDTQLRAALDLAIHTSKYNRTVDPNTYNMLLARLGNVPAPGPGEAFGTIPGKLAKEKVTLVKASTQIRKMAVHLANENPKMAFELFDLSTRLAEQQEPEEPKEEEPKKASSDKYTKLRSLIIRTAAADAEAKKVLLPILQVLKGA